MSAVRTVTVFQNEKSGEIDSRYDTQRLPGGVVICAFLDDNGNEAIDMPLDKDAAAKVMRLVEYGRQYVKSGEWPDEAYEAA